MEAALAGTLQWFVLRRQVRQAGWWVPVAVAGHAVAAPLALYVGLPDAVWGYLDWTAGGVPAVLSGMTYGALSGMTYGAVTGPVLARLLARRIPAGPARR